MEIPNANKYEYEQNEKQEPSLRERINQAIREARPLIETTKENEEMALLINDFICGRISLKEFNDRNKEKKEISKPGIVEFTNLEEMYNFLKELLQDDKIAEELTEHEREHLNQVVEIGWTAKILCRFFVDEAGEISLKPGILPDIPSNGNEEEIRNKLRLIIEAAHEPSDTDKISTNNKDIHSQN